MKSALALLILLILPQARAARQPAFRALVFTRTQGFRHDSIPAGVEAVRRLGEKAGFAVDDTDDPAAFAPANLGRYKVVVFMNTTGSLLDAAQKTAFEQYIRKGNGFVGVHAATDAEYDWAWYGGLVGAYFKSHPAVQEGVIRVEDRTFPATKMLPQNWRRTDEWYGFRANPRGKVHVLASLDETTIQGGTMGPDHPIIWYHEYDKGRAFYTGLGHTKETFAEPLFLDSLLGGIRWAAGQVKADGRPVRRRWRLFR